MEIDFIFDAYFAREEEEVEDEEAFKLSVCNKAVRRSRKTVIDQRLLASF